MEDQKPVDMPSARKSASTMTPEASSNPQVTVHLCNVPQSTLGRNRDSGEKANSSHRLETPPNHHTSPRPSQAPISLVSLAGNRSDPLEDDAYHDITGQNVTQLLQNLDSLQQRMDDLLIEHALPSQSCIDLDGILSSEDDVAQAPMPSPGSNVVARNLNYYPIEGATVDSDASSPGRASKWQRSVYEVREEYAEQTPTTDFAKSMEGDNVADFTFGVAACCMMGLTLLSGVLS